MPRVSIVILLREKDNLSFLPECLQSVWGQTHSNWEVIFVVLGKIPGICLAPSLSLQETQSWKSRSRLIQVEENLSVSQASNRGIFEARGEFVLRLDPDDKLDENILSVMLPHLESGEYGAVHPDFYKIDASGKIIDYGSPEVSFALNPLDAGVIYRRKLLQDIGGYNEDLLRQVSYELLKRFQQKYKVKQVKLPLYYYRSHGTNMSRAQEEILFARHRIENQGKVLCVIPVRGGSKAILLKNLIPVVGKPLFQWVLEAATRSKLIDEILVSTDHDGIYQTSCELGKTLPRHRTVFRPDYLSTDEISIIPVAKYHMEEEMKAGEKISAVVCLQATSPLVTSEDLDGALHKFFSSDCDSVVSIYQVEHNHPYRVMKKVRDQLYPFNDAFDERVLDRRDLPPCYAYNGAFFIRKPYLLQNYNFKDFGLGKDIRGWVMPMERSTNIDSAFDLRLAELLLKDQKL